MMLGGFSSDAKPVDEDTHAIITSVKDDVEKQLSQTFETYAPHSVKTQVVAGVNYKCKVHVGGDKYIHVTVHQPLPHTKQPAKLMSAEGDKTVGDAL